MIKSQLSRIIILSIIWLLACEEEQEAQYDIAFEIDQKHLIPEGIAIDTTNSDIYITSINERKIIRINKDGDVSDFTTSEKSGFAQGVGLKIDQVRNQVLALSNSNLDSGRISSLYAFDISTGSRIGNYNITGDHFWNDLVVTSDGFVYITDSDNNTVYELSPDRRRLVTFIDHPQIAHPNGICLSADEQKLYLATWQNGIICIDRNTKEILDTNQEELINDKALDGIVMYQNSIIGIQNGFQSREKHRIVQFSLDEQGTNILQEQVIDLNNTHFDVPTTSALLGNALYVIANSHLDNYDDDLSQVSDSSKLKNLIILRYNL